MNDASLTPSGRTRRPARFGRLVGQGGRLMGADFDKPAFQAAEVAGGGHVGNPAVDTGDLRPQVGNLRSEPFEPLIGSLELLVDPLEPAFHPVAQILDRRHHVIQTHVHHRIRRHPFSISLLTAGVHGRTIPSIRQSGSVSPPPYRLQARFQLRWISIHRSLTESLKEKWHFAMPFLLWLAGGAYSPPATAA